MKPSRPHLLGCISLMLLPALFAQQPAKAPAPATKSERVTRAEAKLQELTQAPTVAPGDPLDDVPAAADPVQWRLDNAQTLLRTGLWLKQKGETALAADAANKALALIAAVPVNASTQPQLAARCKELAGLIQEKLVGDAAQARQNFEAAKQLAPNSAPLADSRLKRLDRAEGRTKPNDKDKEPKQPKS